MSTWISVKDELPPEHVMGEDIRSYVVRLRHLLSGVNGLTDFAAYLPERLGGVHSWRPRYFNADDITVTHWMPLPDPPEDKP